MAPFDMENSVDAEQHATEVDETSSSEGHDDANDPEWKHSETKPGHKSVVQKQKRGRPLKASTTKNAIDLEKGDKTSITRQKASKTALSLLETPLGPDMKFKDLKQSTQIRNLNEINREGNRLINQLKEQLATLQNDYEILQLSKTNVYARGTLQADDHILVMRKTEDIALQWQDFATTWAVEPNHFHRLDESAKGNLRLHMGGKDAIGSQPGIGEIFEYECGTRIVLHALIARAAVDFLKDPLGFVRFAKGLDDSDIALKKVFDLISNGDVASADVVRSVLVNAFSIVIPPTGSLEKRRWATTIEGMKDKYVKEVLDSIENSPTNLLVTGVAENQVTERRENLRKILRSTLNLSQYLWGQGLHLKIRSFSQIRFTRESYQHGGPRHEAHSSMGLRCNSKVMNDRYPDIVYQPGLLLFGNDDGKIDRKGRMILKSGWWMMEAARIQGSRELPSHGTEESTVPALRQVGEPRRTRGSKKAAISGSHGARASFEDDLEAPPSTGMEINPDKLQTMHRAALPPQISLRITQRQRIESFVQGADQPGQTLLGTSNTSNSKKRRHIPTEQDTHIKKKNLFRSYQSLIDEAAPRNVADDPLIAVDDSHNTVADDPEEAAEHKEAPLPKAVPSEAALRSAVSPEAVLPDTSPAKQALGRDNASSSDPLTESDMAVQNSFDVEL